MNLFYWSMSFLLLQTNNCKFTGDSISSYQNVFKKGQAIDQDMTLKIRIVYIVKMGHIVTPITPKWLRSFQTWNRAARYKITSPFLQVLTRGKQTFAKQQQNITSIHVLLS